MSLFYMVFTGGVAWLGLWQWRRFGRVATWSMGLVLVLGVLTLATVSRAANLGGEIRHPEIRVTQDSADLAFGRRVGNYISNTPWTWVACEALHLEKPMLMVPVFGSTLMPAMMPRNSLA